MKRRFKSRRIRKPLGRIRGRIADKNYRWAYGRQCQSRLAEDYRSSMQLKDTLRLERFGEAGILAKQTINNPILKDIWQKHFDKNQKTRHGHLYNLISGRYYSELKRVHLNESDEGESATAKVSNTDLSFLRSSRDYRRIAVVPEGRFTAGASISFNRGSITAEPNRTERFNGLTGIILFWNPVRAAGRLMVKESKCRNRNAELRRIEEVRSCRGSIVNYLKLINNYLKLKSDLLKRHEEINGAGCRFVCETEADLLEKALDKTEINYITGICKGIKELMGIEHLPSEDNCFEAEWALQDADAMIVKEHYRMKEEYENIPVKKYMNKRIYAAAVNFEKGEDGVYYLADDIDIKEAAESFRNYFLYLSFYKKDAEGLAEYWSDGFTIHGKTGTDSAEAIKFYAAIILSIYISMIKRIEFIQRE